MTLWILDTDHLSLLQRGHDAVSIRLGQKRPAEVVITIISIEEQLRGRLQTIRRARTEQQLRLAYQRLSDALEVFKDVPQLPFDQAAYEQYAVLKSQVRIGTQDLRIGAIALSRQAIVVTRNRKDFENIPGLQIEDWTVA